MQKLQKTCAKQTPVFSDSDRRATKIGISGSLKVPKPEFELQGVPSSEWTMKSASSLSRLSSPK